MLRWRLLLGTLLIALLIALCWLDNRAEMMGVWLLPVAIAVTILATKEMLDLLAAANMKPVRWPIYLANLVVVLGPWIVYSTFVWHITSSTQSRLIVGTLASPDTIAWMFVAVVCLIEMVRYKSAGGITANIAGAILAFLYVGVMLHYAMMLRMSFGVGAWPPGFFVVKMGDTGAYAVGRWLGRHKLAPRISPGKTIEGAAGGLFFSCLASWASFQWLIPACDDDARFTAPGWGWLVFGLLVGAAGIFGDLAESLLKRDVGRKDSSDWLPGFGGVLDILDSLLLSAPVAWWFFAAWRFLA